MHCIIRLGFMHCIIQFRFYASHNAVTFYALQNVIIFYDDILERFNSEVVSPTPLASTRRPHNNSEHS